MLRIRLGNISVDSFFINWCCNDGTDITSSWLSNVDEALKRLFLLFVYSSWQHLDTLMLSATGPVFLITSCLFVYLGFNVAFNTVQVISRRVVGRAEETST